MGSQRIQRQRSLGIDRDEYDSLKIITINVPLADLMSIEIFCNGKITPSRSEYIRIAIKNQLDHDLEAMKNRIDLIKGKIKLDPKKSVLVPGYNGDKPFKIVRKLD